jgi:YHS domain-containing protein
MLTRYAIALAMGIAFVGAKGFEDEEFKLVCPVSGQPATDKNQVDYMGRKVSFCCPNCPKAFKADPKKFAAKTNLQLFGTKQATQVACPLSGEAIDASTAIEVMGVKVAFCCNNCKAKAEWEKDQVALLFADFDKGFTVQTVCPVSGQPIKADKMVEYKGKKVYFCCENCPKAFEKEPTKFAAKVPQLAEEKK